MIYIENWLSFSRAVSFRFQTVIIFISFVSHDFNFRLRFRRFANDFVMRGARSFVCLLCHFDSNLVKCSNKQTYEQMNKQTKIENNHFPGWFWNRDYQYTGINLLSFCTNQKKWSKKAKFNLDSSDLKLLINFNRFSFTLFRFRSFDDCHTVHKMWSIFTNSHSSLF